MLIAIGLLVAYFYTGWDMLLFHHASAAMDRPAYVRSPFYVKVLTAAIWPYVCWRNKELSWFFCSYIGSSAVVIVLLALLKPHISYFWAILILVLCKLLPVAGKLLSFLCTAVASAVWFLLSRLFGWKVPSAVSRHMQEQKYRENQKKLARITRK